MALTNTQITERILALEEKVNDIQTALNNLATKDQIKSLLAILNPVDTDSDIEERVEEVETALNSIQIAMNKLATQAQLKSFVNIKQSAITDMEERITSLETQVATLQD